MSTSTREQIQGPSADERERRRLAGIHLTRRAEVVKQFDLNRDEQRRLDTLDASDPEIAAYRGFPKIQAQAMRDSDIQATQETARRTADRDRSLRAHFPTQAIFDSVELTPPGELPYFGE